MVHTDIPEARWHVVESDDKRSARLNMIAHFLSTVPYTDVEPPGIEIPDRPPASGSYERPPRERATYVPDHVAEVLREADVALLSEVDRGWYLNGGQDQLSILARLLDRDSAFAPAADPVWGDAVLSRFPIEEAVGTPLPSYGAVTGAQALSVRLDVSAVELVVPLDFDERDLELGDVRHARAGDRVGDRLELRRRRLVEQLGLAGADDLVHLAAEQLRVQAIAEGEATGEVLGVQHDRRVVGDRPQQQLLAAVGAPQRRELGAQRRHLGRDRGLARGRRRHAPSPRAAAPSCSGARSWRPGRAARRG